MKKVLMVFFVCMLFALLKANAQPFAISGADTIVHLSIGTYSEFSEPVKVSLLKKKGKVVAIYLQADSIDRAALHRDTTYKRLIDLVFKGLQDRNDDKLRDLARKYQAVFRDTVITDNDSLIAAINNVVMQSNEELERNEINKHRIVLDGFSTSFEITTNGNTRKVYARTPQANSHPALYQLIKQTFAVFWQQKRKFQPRGLAF